MSQIEILNILKEPDVRASGIDLDTLCARLYDDTNRPTCPKDTVRVSIGKLKAKGIKITNKFIGRGNKAVYRLDDERAALNAGLKYAREAYRLATLTVGHLSDQLDPVAVEEAKRRVEEIAADVKLIETELDAI
ncbi:hypothetical protein EVC29_101 [Rhizobium phage RHph_Y52]|nr:hypothetical protein EVC16_101 [Rhizobium phage RHph_Y21]QIG76802.1 hypothetical protein EVC29_101 [Rhizobium phage RHph_Y52]